MKNPERKVERERQSERDRTWASEREVDAKMFYFCPWLEFIWTCSSYEEPLRLNNSPKTRKSNVKITKKLLHVFHLLLSFLSNSFIHWFADHSYLSIDQNAREKLYGSGQSLHEEKKKKKKPMKAFCLYCACLSIFHCVPLNCKYVCVYRALCGEKKIHFLIGKSRFNYNTCTHKSLYFLAMVLGVVASLTHSDSLSQFIEYAKSRK